MGIRHKAVVNLKLFKLLIKNNLNNFKFTT